MLFTLTLEGNLAGTPELRYTPDGVAVARMRLLRNARRRNTDGQWVDGRTLSLDVTCWRGLAERVAGLNKGDTLVVDCADDLRVESFGDRTFLRVTATNVAVSMRFAGAASYRKPKEAAASGDTVRTPDGEEFDAASYAEYSAERGAALATA